VSSIATPNRDSEISARFDLRIRTASSVLIPIHVVVIIVNAAVDGMAVSALAHLLMAGIALYIMRRSGDAIRGLIFAHVYWTFSFMTFLFAVTHWQTASHGLGNADRAALIALTSQAGLLLAFLVSPGTPVLPADRAPLFEARRHTLEGLQWPLIAIGLFGLFAEVNELLPDAYSSTLVLLLYVALSIRISARSLNPLTDPTLLLIVGAMFTASVLNNARSDLLGIILLLAFGLVMTAERILTPGKLILAYLVWRFATVFSGILLSIRWARESSQSMVDLFAASFLSMDTLWKILNPFHVAAWEQGTRRLRTEGFHSEFLGNIGDITARLTVLPQMDIVTSRINEGWSERWGELWNTVLSALPSFGQPKELIFSDEVVWELGLRFRDSVGRPMITAEGELYAIGGYLAVFLIIPVCYLAMYWGYRLIARATGSRGAAILVVSHLFISSIFSTTLLSIVTVSIRAQLQMLIVLTALLMISSLLRREHGGQREPLGGRSSG
jgi:hypothetical protein